MPKNEDKLTLEDIIMMAKALDSAALPKGTRLYWCPKDNEVKEIKEGGSHES